MSNGERPSANVIERIRKILAKTQDAGCPQAEAETAFAMASKILTEHNLSIDDIAVHGGPLEEKYVDIEVIETGRWSIENNLAYHVVQEYFFVAGFFSYTYKGRVLHLFGTESNVATARFTFFALLSSADRLWTEYKIRNHRPGSEGRMFRTGVMKGFSDKLKEERELQKMERDILTHSSGGTALALVRVEDRTRTEMKKAFPNLRKGKGPDYSALQGHSSTLQAGYEAGKKLNINRGIDGKGQKGLN